MIRGSVGEDQQARIAVDIMGDDGHSRSVEAVLDTGFNGSLSLPTNIVHIVQMLGLQSVGHARSTVCGPENFRAGQWRKVNLKAPLSHRLLVDFRGRLPVGFSPMRDLPQYQPIVAAEAARAAP